MCPSFPIISQCNSRRGWFSTSFSLQSRNQSKLCNSQKQMEINFRKHPTTRNFGQRSKGPRKMGHPNMWEKIFRASWQCYDSVRAGKIARSGGRWSITLAWCNPRPFSWAQIGRRNAANLMWTPVRIDTVPRTRLQMWRTSWSVWPSWFELQPFSRKNSETWTSQRNFAESLRFC